MIPGLLLVDKPTGPTSHDMVGRGRRVLGTRRVGHAGTLDPLASGLLILGVERGTKLLGHLSLADKTYLATIRLGASTTTDDSQGDVVTSADASGVTDAAIWAGVSALTGDLMQVPSSVSAIKVDGKRAYELVRAGETVTLAARPVTVSRFDILDTRRKGETIEVDVLVDCTTGTYIRALARDLGAALGVGAHLTALRRTRIGPFDIADAIDLWPMGPDDRGAAQALILPAARAAELSFPTREASADEARDLSYGRPLAAVGINGTYAVLDSDGELLALLAEVDERAKPVLVWHAAS
ncbi:MAG: tRNA pseudouridine(55) synthase TruB [Nakamurella sp.]